MRLSRSWVKKYATMEDKDSEWSQERIQESRDRNRADIGEGTYSSQDGRFHIRKSDEAALKKRHQERTEKRNVCKFWLRGWCNKGYACTLRHGDRVPRRAWYNDQDDEAKVMTGVQKSKRERQEEKDELAHIYRNFSTPRAKARMDPRAAIHRLGRPRQALIGQSEHPQARSSHE